jgi:hypothetical protein
MPYLSWIEKTVGANARPLDRLRAELRLELGSEEIRDLTEYLEAIYVQRAGELRLEINSQWVLFWKRREDGSRTLMAHPEENQWVGTIALEDQMSSRVIATLQALQAGEEFSLRQIGELASVSNLELIISRVGLEQEQGRSS